MSHFEAPPQYFLRNPAISALAKTSVLQPAVAADSGCKTQSEIAVRNQQFRIWKK